MAQATGIVIIITSIAAIRAWLSKRLDLLRNEFRSIDSLAIRVLRRVICFSCPSQSVVFGVPSVVLELYVVADVGVAGVRGQYVFSTNLLCLASCCRGFILSFPQTT